MTLLNIGHEFTCQFIFHSTLTSLAITNVSKMLQASKINVIIGCLAMLYLPIMSLSAFQHLVISDLVISSSVLKCSIPVRQKTMYYS